MNNNRNVAKRKDHNSFKLDPSKRQQAMSLILSSSFCLHSNYIQVTNDFLVVPLILFHCISVTVQTNIITFLLIFHSHSGMIGNQ